MPGFQTIGTTRGGYELRVRYAVGSGELYCCHCHMTGATEPDKPYTVSMVGSLRASEPFAQLDNEEIFAVLKERALVALFGTNREELLADREDKLDSGTKLRTEDPKKIRRIILTRLNAIRYLDPAHFRDRGLPMDEFLLAFGIDQNTFYRESVSLMERGYVRETTGKHGRVWFMHITQKGVEAVEELSRCILVAMPLGKDYDQVYEKGIKAACENSGYECKRVDKEEFNHEIVQEICNEIAKARFMIADISAQNPCVYYEVGYTHAHDRGKVIFVINDLSEAKFDVNHFQIIEYKDDIEALRKQLEGRLTMLEAESFI